MGNNFFHNQKQHLAKAKGMLDNGAIKSIIFSGGTYQIEVFDEYAQDTFWPFLQIDTRGQIIDSFCSCNEAEKEGTCVHQVAAFLKISSPVMHVRFNQSFWNRLCGVAFDLYGGGTDVWQKSERGTYDIIGKNAQLLCSIHPLTKKGEELVKEYIFEKVEETEETSLKFSNLSSQELALWKRGTPSKQLQYELAFWCDLSKWMFLQQAFDKPYKVIFHKNGQSLPTYTTLEFVDLLFRFEVTPAYWESLIPSLDTVISNLTVHHFRNLQLISIEYYPNQRTLHIHSESIKNELPPSVICVGDKWMFDGNTAFYPQKLDPLIQQPIIYEHQLATFFERYKVQLKEFLVGTTLHSDPIAFSYCLDFDIDYTLHIDAYAFTPGDLNHADTVFFDKWVYIPGKGFYQHQGLKFSNVQTRIPQSNVGAFVNEHRLWLNEYKEFHTHLSKIEVTVAYSFDLSILLFHSGLSGSDSQESIIDFGEWCYIRGKGFYRKTSQRGVNRLPINIGIEKCDISAFIYQHLDDLENVKYFFSDSSPLIGAYLNITIDNKIGITISPYYEYD